MTTGDVTVPTVQADGAGFTFTALGITAPYMVNPTKLAAAFALKQTAQPDGTPIDVKIGFASITATEVAGNAFCVVDFKPHADNPKFCPLVRSLVGDVLKATWEAGTLSGTGGDVAALAAATVTNSSAVPSPKTIGGWSIRPGVRASGILKIPVYMDHIDGCDKAELYKDETQVDKAIVPTAWGFPAWLIVKAAGEAVAVTPSVKRYQFTVDAADYPDGLVEFDLVLTPSIGDLDSVRDTRNGDLAGDIVKLPVYFNHGGTLTQSILYISVSGNDTTGDGSLSLPYRTAQKAYDQLATKDGGVIRCLPGDYTAGDLLIAGQANAGEPVTIDGLANGMVTWTPAAVQQFSPLALGAYLVYRNILFKIPPKADLQAFIECLFNKSGSFDQSIAFERCEVTGDAALADAGQLIYAPAFKAVHLHESYVHDIQGVISYATHVRDVLWHDIANAGFQGTAVVETTYGTRLSSVNGAHVDGIQLQNDNTRRARNIWYFNLMFRDVDPTEITGILNIGGKFNDISIVNVLGNVTGVAGSQCVISGNDHVVVRNLTIYNEGILLWGTGNDGGGAVNCNRSFRDSVADLLQYINDPGDVPRTAHFDNWNLRDPVGFQGLQDIGSNIRTLDTNLFVNAAGGNFHPGSNLLGTMGVDAALYPTDVGGVGYPTDGTGAIGAFGSVPATPITGASTRSFVSVSGSIGIGIS